MYRRAWIGYALALVVVLAGFWPSFYGGRTYPIDGLHVAHGVLATAWMLLLIAQGWLIAYRHNRIHRWLGWSSVVIAPLFVISGVVMERAMLAQAAGLPWSTEAKLTWLDLWTLVLFAGLYVAAMLRRRRVIDHARYVTATVIILLPPALGRLTAGLFGGLEATLPPITALLCAIVVALMILDRRVYRLKPHPAYLATLVFLLGVQLTYPLTGQPWFADFGRWVAGV